MLSRLRVILSRSKAVGIAYYICKNQWTRVRLAFGSSSSLCGATHRRLSQAQSLAYINRVFADYMCHGQIPAAQLAGATVLELGPGDNFGVALRFLAAGASQMVCLDRFYARRDDRQQYAIYRALREQMSGEELRRFDEAVRLTDRFEINPRRLRYLYGQGLEAAADLLPPGSLDLIVSRSVLQYVHDLRAGFDIMHRLLRPGGRMCHQVDLRAVEMFAQSHWHPLTFLTIPDRVYQLMASHSPSVNRERIGSYRSELIRLGHEHRILVSGVAGRGALQQTKEGIAPGVDYDENDLELIRAVRPHLAERFRSLPDEELLVASVFIVARKPGPQGNPTD